MLSEARKAARGPLLGPRANTTILKEVIKMDMPGIIDFVQNLGFPVACVVALFWTLKREQEQHKEEMQRITEALNNNTLALTELKSLWGK